MAESDSGMGASSCEEAPPVPRHPESEQSSGEDAVLHLPESEQSSDSPDSGFEEGNAANDTDGDEMGADNPGDDGGNDGGDDNNEDDYNDHPANDDSGDSSDDGDSEDGVEVYNQPLAPDGGPHGFFNKLLTKLTSWLSNPTSNKFPGRNRGLLAIQEKGPKSISDDGSSCSARSSSHVGSNWDSVSLISELTVPELGAAIWSSNLSIDPVLQDSESNNERTMLTLTATLDSLDRESKCK